MLINDSSILIIIIIYISVPIVLVILGISLYCYFIKKVKLHSNLYKELIYLNKEYNLIFYNEIKKINKYYERCKTKQKYDALNSNFNKVFQEYLENKLDYYSDLINKIIKNKKNYQFYLLKYQEIYSITSKSLVKGSRVPYKIFLALEKKLYIKNKLTPILDSSIVIYIEYTSPAGRNHYKKEFNYSLNNIEQWIPKIRAILNYKETKEYQTKIERSKITPSVRYDVLRRDNNTCQICKADDVKLHVNHIIPISKGGKSTLNNLQTLCEICNIGKSNKI